MSRTEPETRWRAVDLFVGWLGKGCVVLAVGALLYALGKMVWGLYTGETASYIIAGVLLALALLFVTAYGVARREARRAPGPTDEA